MGKRKPVDLPSISFVSQTKATEFFRYMLNRYSDGEEINSDDHEILYELLLRHPNADEKTGKGIKRFYRKKSQDYPTSCFHLERLDGSHTDFSYQDCITRSEPTVEEYFYNACRQAVSAILTNKKNMLFDNGEVFCYKTKELVSKETSELRHTEPRFFQIIRAFKEKYNITASRSMFIESEDMQYAMQFSDDDLKNKFIEFHQERARLEIFKKYER